MIICVETKLINENNYQYVGRDENGNQLFKNTIENEHHGIVEFISCVHALMYIKKQKINADVFIDNAYIKQCVESKTYPHKAKTDAGSKLLKRCLMFLLDERKTIIIYINQNQNGKN